MKHQKPHIRTSKKGRKFRAGKGVAKRSAITALRIPQKDSSKYRTKPIWDRRYITAWRDQNLGNFSGEVSIPENVDRTRRYSIPLQKRRELRKIAYDIKDKGFSENKMGGDNALYLPTYLEKDWDPTLTEMWKNHRLTSYLPYRGKRRYYMRKD